LNARTRNALEVVLLALLTGWVLITWHYPAGDFLNNAWAPARLLWLGSSPYDQAAATHLLAGHTTQPVLRAMWTPLALPLFLPLSFIPPRLAANLWFLAHFGWLFLAITLPVLRQATSAGGWLRALPLLLFPPALNGLMLGQVTAFVVVLLLAGALTARQGHPRLAGFLMAGALIKPQLTPLLFLAVGIWALQRGCGRQIVEGGLAALGSGLGVVVIWRPAVLQEYVAALQSNPRWLHATLPAIVSEATGNMLAGLGVWLLVSAVVLWITVRLWQRLPFSSAIVWTLALTLLVSPYVWSWDQVLLLPLMGETVHLVRGWYAGIWWGGIALIAGGYLWIGLHVQNASHLYTWVPYAVLALAWTVGPLSTFRRNSDEPA